MNSRLKDLLANIDNEPRKEYESILIIDGLNTFLRSFTMINHINQNGHHIGGLTGFLKSIGYGIRLTNPTKVIVTFDGVGGSDSRKNLYPEYKANRHKKRKTNFNTFSNIEDEDESINNQMNRLIQYLQCLPIILICIDGLEADDIIGYLATKFDKLDETEEITLMSSDQDFLQLVNNKIKVYSPTKKLIYDVDRFKAEFGIYPNNYLMYKTFMGDAGDNVPKVKGLGETKFFNLLPQIKEQKTLTLNESLELIDSEDKWGILLHNYKKQLEINHRIMDLGNICLSEGNLDIIKNSFANEYKLDSVNFTQMYLMDLLGDSIPSPSSWLNQTFGSLNSFN